MIAIPKHILVAGGIVSIAATGIFLADRNGYNRAVAKIGLAATQAVEQAKKEQAETQKAMTDIVDQYYLAAEAKTAAHNALESTKAELRRVRHRGCYESTGNGTVLPAVYRMFNTAADHPELSAAIGSRIPDEAGDGLDAIQYAVTDRNDLAIKVNTLQAIIRKSGCFSVSE